MNKPIYVIFSGCYSDWQAHGYMTDLWANSYFVSTIGVTPLKRQVWLLKSWRGI